MCAIDGAHVGEGVSKGKGRSHRGGEGVGVGRGEGNDGRGGGRGGKGCTLHCCCRRQVMPRQILKKQKASRRRRDADVREYTFTGNTYRGVDISSRGTKSRVNSGNSNKIAIYDTWYSIAEGSPEYCV